MWRSKGARKGCIMMLKFEGRMENGGHYDVEMKGYMKQGAI